MVTAAAGLQVGGDSRILPHSANWLSVYQQPVFSDLATGSPTLYALRLNRCYRQEPNWRPANQFVGVPALQDDAPWLLDTGSLTAHLRRQSAGNFRVQVLSQHWGLPRLSERRLLSMGDRDWGLIREVLLCCHDEPWVYARSVMPARSLTGHLRRLRGLDSRPLGHLLFTDRSMRRIPYEICRLPAAQLPLEGLPEQEAALWGRRSCFVFDQRPIMVSEIFLPEFQPWC